MTNTSHRKSEPMVNTTTMSQKTAQINTGGVTKTAPIPDLTTMSDHDLISYINPSCFDQGNFSAFIKFIVE